MTTTTTTRMQNCWPELNSEFFSEAAQNLSLVRSIHENFSPTIPGQKVGLLESCTVGDVCVDVNAQCRGGYCQCMGNFRTIGNKCGTFFSEKLQKKARILGSTVSCGILSGSSGEGVHG